MANFNGRNSNLSQNSSNMFTQAPSLAVKNKSQAVVKSQQFRTHELGGSKIRPFEATMSDKISGSAFQDPV